MANIDEEILGTVEDESGNSLLAMDINQLRASCKLFSIPASKDWKKEDYLTAIRDKLKQVELITAAKALSDSTAPKAGHSRITIHKDPSATASNSGVIAAVNGRIFIIPRGIEVEIPNPVLEVLKNSTTHHTQNTNTNAKNMTEERFEHIVATAYPYTVHAVSDGPYINPNDQRQKVYKLRLQFLAKYGKWPTGAELGEAITHGRIDALIA